MLEIIKDTVSYIKTHIQVEPEIGIVLGTGLGGLVKEIDIHTSLSYEKIPNFPISTVEGHSGKLIFGKLGGKNVVAMQGRFHYYEGYDMNQVVFPIRVMKYLGIKTLFLSNASGGVNPDFEIGDLMIITDHICLVPNPLIGKNEPEFGTRFPDMSEAYDKNLIAKAKQVAQNLGIKVTQGVYTATSGPTFETPSEYKYFRIIGSDTVGMSTAPEVITARHLGLPCFAMSIITDLGVPGKIVEVTHEEVQKVAAAAESKMTQIFKQMIAEI
ncbi:MAG: purine-nucleoside phosphorylase [Bacteroidota bacterium]|jgi:purine-nucleoside phosphorylase|nr:purine-nucleoside phosphorylase [Bacteroidales bacterium]MDI9534422.1 purine-nucleoside phosphorylase [Bacteroidota bacterium]NLP20978.1 purine-nucleoside phosphorylase [Bacteroidales bacterium]HNY43607.1 purine-nucleoside phosphorylase [Bacteroidales bacterium]HOD89252.1 purine-nucleoside phosphorylase [Bacteroidales bacterium]